jgi:hypothetical protein
MHRCHRLALALLVASGCTIVDAEPYQALPASIPRAGAEAARPDAEPDAEPRADGGGAGAAGGGEPDASGDGAVDAGEDSGPPRVIEPLLSDRCPEIDEDTYLLPPGTTALTLDTTELRNDVDRAKGLKCTDTDTPGNDGFLAVDMRFGDVWHIHMAADPDPEHGGKNPAFYVLDSTCDVRDCGFGIDICQAGSDEHFTFAARRDGIHYLGIDDRTEGGGLYTFTATRVECGNGLDQHGKACESSKDLDCDDECRIVLNSVNPRESSEAHDDFTSANAISFPEQGARIVNVAGNIGGCEPDYYTFVAGKGDRVRITVLTETEQPCTGSPRLALQLEDARVQRLQAGETSDANSCPSLTRADLVEGRYYVKLSDTLENGTEQRITYKLRVEINPL